MAEYIARESDLYRPEKLDEDTLEKQVEHLAPTLFPGYRWCPFKVKVRSPEGVAFPDAALVARDCSRWYVVEVELARHSWEDHVRPQLTRLLAGHYTRKHFECLSSTHKTFNENIDALDIYHPDLIVIIDQLGPQLSDWCRQHSVLCIEASPFKSRSNDVAFSVVGALPRLAPATGPTIVAEATKVSGPDAVVRFEYAYATEFTETVEAFELYVGQRAFLAQSYNSHRGGFLLAASTELFESEVGRAERFDLIRCRNGTIEVREHSKGRSGDEY